ncbi:hypothetical protein CBR_g6403 [Chara braunii]|uniref:Putative rRNA methyltransferase n=1 Tax=Chara braunii TaxID=69332 RepID=A0A388KJS4_CHABU|nr:hypothetical protein CBR_g6403 [Chara braunii]|eukprot:GBG70276.1 hypothetical protein CBR_g6403 [Chara braunii]
MGKTKTSGKGRLDKYYHLAKEQGYRSRAAFKLVQLNRKYQFLEKSRTLLDLCAAPGGWLQVAVKYMPMSSLIIGVDLFPIKPIRGCVTFTEDITTPKCRTVVKKELKGNLLDVVLHDGAPNVGGTWAKDSYSQAALTLDSLKLATDFLAPGGLFITKVFRSRDYNALLYAFNQLFDKVESTKPMASRNTSAEIYVVCRGFKAPKKIDPRLLDPRVLFEDVSEPAKPIDVLHDSKRKRHRDGYEEGASVLFKSGTAAAFMSSDKPAEFLGTFNVITFTDPESVPLKTHSATNDEILALCEDLRVLGKGEFKRLLKWRTAVKKDTEAKKDDEKVTKEEAPKLTEEEHEIVVLKEMEEMKELMDTKKRKAKKKLAKQRQKERLRAALRGNADATDDLYGETGLFSLSAIKSNRELKEVEEVDTIDDEDWDASDADEDEDVQQKESESDDDGYDSDGQKRKYQAELEDYFDRAYREYMETMGKSAKRKRRARLQDEDAELPEGNDEEDQDGGVNVKTPEERRKLEDLLRDGEDDERDANPLLVPLVEKEKKTKLEVTKTWFEQDVFEGFEKIGDDEDDNGDRGTGNQLAARPKSMPKLSNTPAAYSAKPNAKEEAGGRQKPEPEGGRTVLVAKKSSAEANGHSLTSSVKPAEEEGFEVVPMEQDDSDSDSTDSSDDEMDYDSDEKAEILAYAKKMLRKKQREEIIDSAYNRYTFNDDNLPQWFANDERKHMKPLPVVTKEEVEAARAENKAIDARPVKKVAEAKARKRRRIQKKLEAVRQRANAIANQEDLNSRSKNKMIDKLYKKVQTRPPKKEVVVVRGKSGKIGANAGKGKLRVDKRMLKDKRQRGTGKIRGRGKGPVKTRNSAKGGGKGSKGGKERR